MLQTWSADLELLYWNARTGKQVCGLAFFGGCLGDVGQHCPRDPRCAPPGHPRIAPPSHSHPPAHCFPQVTLPQRDTDWATWTCALGFPVMGIWPNFSDGTDINSLDRSKDSKVRG